MRPPRTVLIWAILMAAAVAAMAAAAPAGSGLARPNIVLITLDTTRADRMGFLGSKRGSPQIWMPSRARVRSFHGLTLMSR